MITIKYRLKGDVNCNYQKLTYKFAGTRMVYATYRTPQPWHRIWPGEGSHKTRRATASK